MSDQPMAPEESRSTKATSAYANYTDMHLHVGYSLRQLINQGLTVKHLRF